MLATVVLAALLLKQAEAFVLQGSDTSYAQFRKWQASPNSSLEFEFRTTQPNGVLLYTDDGGYYDFVELKLVDGSVRLRFNFGSGAKVLTVGSNLADGNQWHKVALHRQGDTTTLVVDNERDLVLPRPPPHLTQANLYAASGVSSSTEPDLYLGNITTNSYVYVGGLPSWYSTSLSSLALPSVVFEPRFKGAIRNLVYADETSRNGRPRHQEVMAYKGVRANPVIDACARYNPCQHDAICIATDDGPICDCRFIDYSGQYCEKAREAAEATFTGDEYLSYDLVQMGKEPILSTQDKISLHFKTTRAEGLLFHTGDGEDYLNLALKDGGVALTVNLGSGRLDTGIKRPDGKTRFNDDQWHHVEIHRVAREVNMTVDGVFTEKWMTTGAFNMLASSKVFIGGSEAPYKLPGTNSRNNFIGCLKKVEFRADSLYLPLLRMAQEGNRLVHTVGKLEYRCTPAAPVLPIAFTSSDSYLANHYIMQQGGVVSFTRPQAFLALPTWNNSDGGSMSFKFRTNEPNGLLFFNGGKSLSRGDFFAMELLDGYLYLHLDQGSGAIKLRGSNRRLDDTAWHKVEVLRNRKTGSITVGEDKSSFETPGESSYLDLGGPLYMGGMDPSLEPFLVPPVLWTATLKKGFVGCVRDVVLNGMTMDVAEYAKRQDSGSIRTSCHVMPPMCSERPCMHGGTCHEGWNRYICDCSKTSFTGPTCGRLATTVRFDGTQHLRATGAGLGAGVSEAESLSFRFRTVQSDALLVATRDYSSADKLEIVLDKGRLKVAINMGLTEKTVIAGEKLHDDRWHSVVFERRSMVISLAINDETPLVADIYGSESFLDYSHIYAGAIESSTTMQASTAPNLKGHLQGLTFNGFDFFEAARLFQGDTKNELVVTGTFGESTNEVLYHEFTFKTKDAYMGLSQIRAYYDIKLFFYFRTTASNGLIMYNAGRANDNDFIALELVNGHVHYVIHLGGSGSEPISIKDSAPAALNDNKWHSVAVGRPEKLKHTLLIDEHFLSTEESKPDGDIHLDLDGILFLGGVRKSMYGSLPSPIASSFGYQGCMASLDLNGVAANPLQNALVPSSQGVSKGCPGGEESEEPSQLRRPSHAQQKRQNHHHRMQQHEPPKYCSEQICENEGVCKEHEQWAAPSCDCDLTSFTGPLCTDESVAYEWVANPGLIRYYYDQNRRPDTNVDYLSFGFITALRDAVLLRVDSNESNDYIEVELVSGNIFVSYNLGTKDIAVGDINVSVADGLYHVVRFTRSGPNSTIQIDDNQMQRKYSVDRQLSVFNSQYIIQIGGKWNPTLNRVERPYRGVMAGLVYNGLRPLDLAADGDELTKVHGDVAVLDRIPFDYKEKHADLFKKHAVHDRMQKTNPSGRIEPGVNDDIIRGRTRCTGPYDEYYDTRCFTFDGSGDELVTPVYTPPERPREHQTPDVPTPDKGYRRCLDDDDEDDDCHEGSADHEISYIDSDNNKVILGADDYDLFPSGTSTKDWRRWPEKPTTTTSRPTHPPPPSANDHTPMTYENYDPKRNVFDEEPMPKEPEQQYPGRATAATAPSTILVIGIIVFAMIAIILIIIIVLKTRTRVETEYKVDESRTYHFSAASAGGEDFEGTNATLGGVTTPGSNPAAAVLRPVNGSSLDHNGYYPPTNGTTATVQPAKKKAVREWYV